MNKRIKERKERRESLAIGKNQTTPSSSEPRGDLTYSTDHKLFSKKRDVVKSGVNWFIVASLAISPVIISIISAIHIYEFFIIGNSKWLSVALAVAFELLAMASLVAIWELKILDKITKSFLWGMVAILVALMVSGNIYSVWLHANQDMVKTAAELVGTQTGHAVQRVLAIIQGGLLPIMSLSFIKILATYIIKKKA